MALPPPKCGEIGAFYPVFERSELSAAERYTAEGIAASQVAQRLGISRRTIYSWVSSYQNRRSNAFGSRLQDRPKPGRPPRKSPRVLRALGVLLQESPRRYGYH